MNLYCWCQQKRKFLLIFNTSIVWKDLTVSKFSYTLSGKKSQGKVTKFITSDYIFPDKNFNSILSNPNFSLPAYHVPFNLMSCDIDIISADTSILDDLIIFVMLKDFLNWKWRALWRHFLYAVTPLSGLAVNVLTMLSIRK